METNNVQGGAAGQRLFSVNIDGRVFELQNSEPTGRELLALVERDPNDFFLVFVVPEAPGQVVELDELFDLSAAGTEHFNLVSRSRYFAIRIDETNYNVVGPTITGQQLLNLARKDPATHFVTQILEGVDDDVIELDQAVDLSQPGRERFSIVAKPRCFVIINAREQEVFTRQLTYEQIVSYAFPDWQADERNTVYTVNYVKGVAGKPEGSVVAGGVVDVKCGMEFDVDRTNRS